jgi:hypothetical protein
VTKIKHEYNRWSQQTPCCTLAVSAKCAHQDHAIPPADARESEVVRLRARTPDCSPILRKQVGSSRSSENSERLLEQLATGNAKPNGGEPRRWLLITPLANCLK